jgi:hypothetical protein
MRIAQQYGIAPSDRYVTIAAGFHRPALRAQAIQRHALSGIPRGPARYCAIVSRITPAVRTRRTPALQVTARPRVMSHRPVPIASLLSHGPCVPHRFALNHYAVTVAQRARLLFIITPPGLLRRAMGTVHAARPYRGPYRVTRQADKVKSSALTRNNVSALMLGQPLPLGFISHTGQ